jgi:ABC-2 type transport system ATP-binding protein
MESCIEIHELTKRFGGRTALNRLTLTVPPGAILALLGENGAGKTTTIRLLTGLLRADVGKATILGRDCWRYSTRLRHRVGYVPERPRFYDWMTVTDIGWFTAGFHRPGFLMRYQELIGHFQLDPSARLGYVSKGQYAKVALALALAPDPEVLILDEPTSGLDLLVRRELLARMVELAGEGKTILVSSHQVAEVERVASHVAFLDHGRLKLVSPLAELRTRLVRIRLRYAEQSPDPASLGTVLEHKDTNPLWQAVIQDPRPGSVEELRAGSGITDVDVAPLPLEEVYTTVLDGKGGRR